MYVLFCNFKPTFKQSKTSNIKEKYVWHKFEILISMNSLFSPLWWEGSEPTRSSQRHPHSQEEKKLSLVNWGSFCLILFPGQHTLPVVKAKQMMLCWDQYSSAGKRSAQKEGSGTHSRDMRDGWLAHRSTVCTSCLGSGRHCFLKWLRDIARSRSGAVIGRARLKLPWTYIKSQRIIMNIWSSYDRSKTLHWRMSKF